VGEMPKRGRWRRFVTWIEDLRGFDDVTEVDVVATGNPSSERGEDVERIDDFAPLEMQTVREENGS